MTAKDPFESAKELSSNGCAPGYTRMVWEPNNQHEKAPFGVAVTPDTRSGKHYVQTEIKEREDDNPSIESARPQLTIQQTAAILGKSVRALERSLIGRWGNKLPEGWNARKIQTENGEEWRITPPIGFRVRSNSSSSESAKNNSLASGSTDFLSAFAGEFLRDAKPQQRLAKGALFRSEHNGIEHATIVIDRSNEVESLLRELLVTQKALSEERRLHMEDLRMVAQLQGHMRLLESSASESTRVKSELEFSQRELNQLKEEYNQLVALPWWKRIFGFGFKRS